MYFHNIPREVPTCKQPWANIFKVCLICFSGECVYFGSKHAFSAKGMKSNMKAADAGKEVNEPIWSFGCVSKNKILGEG